MVSLPLAIPAPTALRSRGDLVVPALSRHTVPTMSSFPPMVNPGSELRRVRSLIADLDAVVWEADARTTLFTFVSEGVQDILGYTPQEWLAESNFWADHIVVEDREPVLRRFVRAITEGGKLDVEYRFHAKDDSVVWLRDLAHVVKDVHGTPVLIRGLMVEITKQKSTEEERADAQMRFRRVVERVPAIVYLESVSVDDDGIGETIYVSPQVESILGFTPDEWQTDPVTWARQFHPDDRERVRAQYLASQLSDEPFICEYRMFAKDGRTLWFRDEAVLVRNETGAPEFWQGIMFDVTGERESAARILETEERYRNLVESLPAIVYSEDVTGTGLQIMYLNSHVETLLGISREEWLNDPGVWLAAIHPDDRGEVDRINRETERTGAPFSAEYRMYARDGRIVWFHDEAVLVRDDEEHPRYWQGIMIDISAQKRAESLEQDLAIERESADHLRELDEMKNTFLQAVSHDLRTPLAAILGLAVTLERGEDVGLDAEESRDLAGRIAQNARKLEKIVNDLLDLDRLSRGLVSPVLRPTDVGALVRSLAEDSDLLRGRTVLIDAASVVVPADAAKVERIVENLLGNTAKHTPPDATVWVRVEPTDDGVLICIEDDGPGVPADLRERIFEPFLQGTSRSSHSPGVGVGLTLVARFAQIQGGRAWVQDREGGGASFRVFLPSEPVVPLEEDRNEHQVVVADSDASQA